MKNLPGIKTALFFTLVFAVGLGVYAETTSVKVNKPRKYIVRFGWSETSAYTLAPVPHTATAITGYLDGTGKPYRLKVQEYKDGKPDGAAAGDFDMCLPIEGTAASPMPTGASPEASPTARPLAAKTQSAGYAQLDTPAQADAFADWVNNP